MKILHFTDNLIGGGKERQMNELIKSLSHHPEIENEVVCMNHPGVNQQFSTNGVSVHYLIRKTKKDPGIFMKFLRLCKISNPDIIHAWDSMTAFYAVPVARMLKIKLINGMIRDAPIKIKFWNQEWIRSRLTFPFSDVVLSNSRAGLKSYSAPLKKALYIHNGFSLDRIKNLPSAISMREKYRINTPYVVGMVAAFSKYKDYKTFFLTANLILKHRDDVSFIAVGDGEKMNQMIKIISPQYKDCIKLLGRQNNVESIINIFDIGVLATFYEGIPNAVMEYMALSKPVVVSDVGGVRELVNDQVTGYLVPRCLPEEMAQRIETLLNDKERAKTMGKMGHQVVKDYFNLDNMITAYTNLYKQLLK